MRFAAAVAASAFSPYSFVSAVSVASSRTAHARASGAGPFEHPDAVNSPSSDAAATARWAFRIETRRTFLPRRTATTNTTAAHTTTPASNTVGWNAGCAPVSKSNL